MKKSFKENKAVTKVDNSLSQKLDRIGVSLLTCLYNNAYIVVIVVATIVALLAKISVYAYPTYDVIGFIFKWIDEIQDLGMKNFYLVNADYSPIYLFFASFLTLIPKGEMLTISEYTFSSNWMLCLKAAYFAVDIVNAFAVYLIIKEITGSKVKSTIGYIVMTALPVQFINSAIWGQADCIYTCFLLFSLYFVLKGKSKLAFLMFGFALSLKLQAVFLAPFLVYLILRRKAKFSDLLFAPIAVIITFIPAYICGAGFTKPFAFYGRQLVGYSNPSLDCANFWHLFSFADSSLNVVRRGAVFISLLFIGAFFAIVWLRMVRTTKESLLNIAIFLAGITVFFLPYMHERYFYLIEVLTVVYALTMGKRYYLILCMQISSLISYQNYIGDKHFIEALGDDSIHIAAFLNLFVLGTLLYDIFKREHQTAEEVIAELKE